jgi:glycosyltransferase involved in cell wall biosynthesis
LHYRSRWLIVEYQIGNNHGSAVCGTKSTANELNILFLNSIEKKVWGGLEHWMEMCGLGLAGAGHNVFFAGRSGSQFQERMTQHQATTFFPLNIAGDFSPTTAIRLRELINDHQIDVVLCNFVKDVRMAGLARILGRDFTIICTPGVNLTRRSLSHRFLFSNWMDALIVPSRHLRDEIVDSGYIPESKFQVIPIGIDEDYWRRDREISRAVIRKKHHLPPDAIVCLTSGRFVNQKGHTYLIEAAGRLKDKCNDAYFIFLGDGPLQSDLEKQIEELGLVDRFIFPGLLADHRDYVFGSDLYVHPAIYEPYGIVLVEAMAGGLPIVASAVGGIPDVVSDGVNAILCPPTDVDALTEAVLRMYKDDDLRRQYSQSSLELFETKYKLSDMIKVIEQSVVETVTRRQARNQ